ncbi:MAG TPA: hypothetical protein VGF45_10580 [Polyangia bacterium]
MRLPVAAISTGLLFLGCVTPTPPSKGGGRTGTTGTGGGGGVNTPAGAGGAAGGAEPTSSGGISGANPGAGGANTGSGGSSGGADSGGSTMTEPDAGSVFDSGSNTIGDVMAAVEALPPPPPLVIDYPPIMPCPSRASIDRLTNWNSHAGSMRPTGSLLTKDAGKDVMKVDFLPGSAWHEVVVPVANSLSVKADLSKSRGMTLTYSSTADFQVQLRPLSHSHGSAQYTAMFPATGGMVKELTLPFTEPTWGAFLGKPTFPISVALSEANFFNFIGRAAVANTIVIRGLRIDGYTPNCN